MGITWASRGPGRPSVETILSRCSPWTHGGSDRCRRWASFILWTEEILHTFNLRFKNRFPPPPISMLRVCSNRRHCDAGYAYAIFHPTGWGGYPKSTSSEKRKHLASNIEIGGKGACGAQNQMISYFVCKNRYLKSMQYKFRPPSEPIKMLYF